MKSKFFYIIINYFIQFLNVMLSLIFMQRFPPVILGDIAIAKIWMQAFDYTHLGSRFALDRFLPLVTQEKHRAMYLNIAMSCTLMCSLLLFIISISMEGYNTIVISFSIVGFFLAISNIYKAYSRATGDIKDVNDVILRLYAIPLLSSVVFLYFSFDAFLLIYPMSFFLSMFFFVRCRVKRIDFRLWNNNKSKLLFGKVFNVSKLLLLNGVITYLLLVIDRFFVDHSLGRAELGNYSVIMFSFAILFMIPSIITELVFPDIVRKVKSDNQVFFVKLVAFNSLVTLLAIIVFDIVATYFIGNFTSYNDLLPLIYLCSFSVLPYCFTSIAYHVFNAFDRRDLLIYANLIALVAYVFYLSVVSFVFSPSLGNFVVGKVFIAVFIFVVYFLFSCYVYKSNLKRV